ncbi:uncharacterized protein LOC6572257 [Drosophila mojavensis]|uniref:PiggyBac transposable element-derived protein domain-containing protein n=1 Tax=Drosophila mojavensis TaxID=7230 RepID=B4KDM6_DROMO|nr:uncharacterized protein LOC6572257 [Drosophila mojavensis]EDW13860.1 uncharacterized protein Dmoj_GI23943 [Drosophila mojavensis]
MSTSGRKRKQQLKPRQDVHRSPVKRQSLDVKTEPLLTSVYPLADYDCVDIKPDLTELQLQLAVASQNEVTAAAAAAATAAVVPSLGDDEKPELEQQSDSDEDGYSEINFGAEHDVFCDDEVDDYDPEWTATQTTPRLIFKFYAQPGQTGLKALRKLTCPLYYFNQLLGNRVEFFGQLAGGCNGRNATLKASAEELETFVGLSLLMCDMKLPQLSDYWSEHTFQGFSGFTSKMGQQRYLDLLHSLSFAMLPGAGTMESTAAGDAGKLINFYNARMAELYASGQQLVLNEPIVQWKGRFSYHNELPLKQRNNALTLHLLSEQSGLIIRMLPERVDPQRQLARNSRQLVAHRCELVLQLLQSHVQRGHSVYACKYYGSYGLAHELAKLGTYCSGLLDRNRYGNSKALIYQQLSPNSIATRYATPLMMAKWRRRREKCVYFYSSDCLAIYAKEMSMQKINARPKLIQELDFQLRPTAQSTRQQLISSQPSCAGLQQQQQLAIFLLNLLVFNAHVLYVGNAQPTRGFDATKLKSYAEFRTSIIKSLLKEDQATPAAAAPAASPTTPNASSKRQDQSHSKRSTHQRGSAASTAQPEPEPEPKHELILIQRNGKPTRKNCRHCHKGGMLQFTRYMCKLCPDMPGLCLNPCFRLWHDLLQQQQKSPN